MALKDYAFRRRSVSREGGKGLRPMGPISYLPCIVIRRRDGVGNGEGGLSHDPEITLPELKPSLS